MDQKNGEHFNKIKINFKMYGGMKKFFTSIFSVFTLIVSLSSPILALAQGNNNVTFQNNLNVTYGQLGTGTPITATISGSLDFSNIGNIGIGNVKVGIKFSETNIPLNYSGSYDVEFYGNVDPMMTDFMGGAFNGTFNNGGSFDPGQTYYVLFKVMPANTISSFPGDAEIMTTFTPGGSNDPNPDPNTNPPQGFDPAVDCLNIIYIQEPECIDLLNNVPEYNPNFVLTTSLSNPLGDGPEADVDIIGFLQRLFRSMVKIAIPFLILFTIYSGFMFVEARGDTKKLEVARKNFLYVIIGALIIFAAWTIATVLKGTVDNISAMNDVIKYIIKLV